MAVARPCVINDDLILTMYGRIPIHKNVIAVNSSGYHIGTDYMLRNSFGEILTLKLFDKIFEEYAITKNKAVYHLGQKKFIGTCIQLMDNFMLTMDYTLGRLLEKNGTPTAFCVPVEIDGKLIRFKQKLKRIIYIENNLLYVETQAKTNLVLTMDKDINKITNIAGYFTINENGMICNKFPKINKSGNIHFWTDDIQLTEREAARTFTYWYLKKIIKLPFPLIRKIFQKCF